MEGGELICKEVYDFDVHWPKALPCGHTFCQFCLDQMYAHEGRWTCSLDYIVYWKKDHSTFPDNQAIKDILEPLQAP
ncbi:MAG: hypothetical protein J0651_00345 [Actinobacteria bacterium]|nr:hypothetical protein [Actinomycetota bacterium]